MSPRRSVRTRVYSYSVLQHFALEDLSSTLSEVRRVLRKGGRSTIEMLSATGPRAIVNQARRGFREARNFEVRYYSPRRLRRIFSERIGATDLRVDGFFSANPQSADIAQLPRRYRAVVRASEALKRVATTFPQLRLVADSVFLESERA